MQKMLCGALSQMLMVLLCHSKNQSPVEIPPGTVVTHSLWISKRQLSQRSRRCCLQTSQRANDINRPYNIKEKLCPWSLCQRDFSIEQDPPLGYRKESLKLFGICSNHK